MLNKLNYIVFFKKVKMKINDVNNIFEKFSLYSANPKTELIYNNNFTLLVAVVLSAQATDASVNKATKELFKIYDTPEKMLQLGEDGLKGYIKTIGLHNSKAKNIIALSKILIKDYNGELPKSVEQLVTLPGVGRKTANVVLNCAFSNPTMPVDTHVFRVAKRLGLAKGATVLAVEKELLSVIPLKWLRWAHNWLVLHGRYICKARAPKCQSCFIKDYCQYFQQLNKNDASRG